ncbi:alpha/beta hydrolase [Pseudorhodoferax sp.]|uniref:alpha/beta hydrolase n=1 Tax=Pseudorhodoferax sp. TaxID=1993553 RepID=UPI002DD6291C|nr:alpha/beta hydrolase [Pseudorhodoferax sp.]
MLPWVLAAAGQARAAGLQPCQLRGVDVPARCGQIERPLDPAQPGGVRIGVHYAVLPALSRNKRQDPVFFFAGGPGQSAIDLAGPVSRLLARLGQRRDIVLVDQRGTGRSAPLYCADDSPPSLRDSTDARRMQQQLVQCRAALQRLPHGDLRHYTTTLAMQDVDAVRRTLGAERINLVGVSYGTRAALELQRQFPATVRRVVLDGVAPPDMGLPSASVVDAQAAFDALLAWCSGDERCRQQHPALAQRWAGLRAALPAEVALPDPLTGRSETLHIDAGLLGALVRMALYSPLLSAALPAALDEAALGRWTALAGLASALMPAGRAARIALGQHFSVICAEDSRAPAAPVPAGAFEDMAERYRQACADWPRGEVPAAFYTVLPSAQPVLLLSGALDPVTPPRHAAAVAQRLGDKARQLVVPGGGHGVLALACVRELAQRFIDASDDKAALALDTGCAAAVPRPPLFQPPGQAAAVAR